MDEQMPILTCDTISAAEANRYASELSQDPLDVSPDVEVHRRRDDSRAQNFGNTLVLLVGTPAAAMVGALSNWPARRTGASNTIKRTDEQILVQHITSKKAGE
jgi:hypothetical protein